MSSFLTVLYHGGTYDVNIDFIITSKNVDNYFCFVYNNNNKHGNMRKERYERLTAGIKQN